MREDVERQQSGGLYQQADADCRLPTADC